MLFVASAECHLYPFCAECSYAECHYAECHYAECRYAECHGTSTNMTSLKKVGRENALAYFPGA